MADKATDKLQLEDHYKHWFMTETGDSRYRQSNKLCMKPNLGNICRHELTVTVSGKQAQILLMKIKLNGAKSPQSHFLCKRRVHLSYSTFKLAQGI